VSEEKGWGKTVLGWFVVREGDDERPSRPASATSGGTGGAGKAPGNAAPVDDTDALLAKYADAPDSPAPAAPVSPIGVGNRGTPSQAPPTSGGPVTPVAVDFAEVFIAGGVDASEQDRVQKASDLLSNLPTDTPTAVKKQIVEASLRAFGFPIESIIEAGVAEIEALDAFIGIGQDTTQKLLADSNARIEQLQAEIIALRTLMETRLRDQDGQRHTCNGKKLEIQRVLEFFGQEAVAKVVRESPRLHEPTDPAADPGPQS
jgi:hypothetical protein